MPPLRATPSRELKKGNAQRHPRPPPEPAPCTAEKFCPSCGKDGATPVACFCNACGGVLVKKPRGKHPSGCEECGAVVSMHARFCTKCGSYANDTRIRLRSNDRVLLKAVRSAFRGFVVSTESYVPIAYRKSNAVEDEGTILSDSFHGTYLGNRGFFGEIPSYGGQAYYYRQDDVQHGSALRSRATQTRSWEETGRAYRRGIEATSAARKPVMHVPQVGSCFSPRPPVHLPPEECVSPVLPESERVFVAELLSTVDVSHQREKARVRAEEGGAKRKCMKLTRAEQKDHSVRLSVRPVHVEEPPAPPTEAEKQALYLRKGVSGKDLPKYLLHSPANGGFTARTFRRLVSGGNAKLWEKGDAVGEDSCHFSRFSGNDSDMHLQIGASMTMGQSGLSGLSMMDGGDLVLSPLTALSAVGGLKSFDTATPI